MILGRILRQTTLALAAFCALVCSQPGWAQTGLTTIQDTLFTADGSRFNGTLTISWVTFDAANIGTIVQQSRTVQVLNGNLQLQLVPNATAVPPANVYTVQYQSDGRSQFTETWTVPVSALPLTVSSVRTGSQVIVNGGNGTVGTPIVESSVVGLVADLAQRPLKGAGFGTNSVAIVDDSGNLETAAGDPGDCVFIDGTTGPCGGPTFSDAETPGGTVDGVNNTLTLALTPLGSSLMLFRNGLYLTTNFDYTLSGSTITFLTGALPQPGDTMTASYRVDTAASGDISLVTQGNPTPLHTAAAQVICSAAGATSSATAWTSLGGCDIPAAGLVAGDRIEIRFTFTHSGMASGFDLQVNWGNTTILARDGSTQDAAVAGTAEAAITATGAQVSLESWGTVLPFLPGILGAPLQSGLKVDFRAALSVVGSDTVTLTNYTVVRYPGN
jgi:hypothetical protein